jgi:hypothetical protein
VGAVEQWERPYVREAEEAVRSVPARELARQFELLARTLTLAVEAKERLCAPLAQMLTLADGKERLCERRAQTSMWEAVVSA